MKLKTFTIFLAITILFIIVSWIDNSDLQKDFNSLPKSELGVNAANTGLDQMEKYFPTPLISDSGNSYLTVNKMGFDVLNTEEDTNWLLESFSKFIDSEKNMTILDVGCGYGRISRMALAQNQTVIANDIAEEHLIYVRKIAQDKHLNIQNLYLNNDYYPQETDFPNNSIDAVVLYDVIHFLSGNEIEEGFRKIHKWLKPKGKMFIAVLSPFNKVYSDWFSAQYEIKWEQGNKWPGEKLPVRRAFPKQEYNLPEYLNVMDDRPLKIALEEHGFHIVKSGFISISQQNSWDKLGKDLPLDKKGIFGVIAEKR